MSAVTQAAAKSAPPVPPNVRTLPVIDPARVTCDYRGFARSQFFVRLPQGFVADDLKEPSAWRRVQQGEKALKVYDGLFLVAYDQSWAAEAIVSEAGREKVTLAGIRIIQTPRQNQPLFRDQTYAVAWDGAGYHVERIADGHRMTQSVGSAALAERDLRNLYPQQVGKN